MPFHVYNAIFMLALPKTTSSPLQIDGWKTTFHLESHVFRCQAGYLIFNHSLHLAIFIESLENPRVETSTEISGCHANSSFCGVCLFLGSVRPVCHVRVIGILNHIFGHWFPSARPKKKKKNISGGGVPYRGVG